MWESLPNIFWSLRQIRNRVLLLFTAVIFASQSCYGDYLSSPGALELNSKNFDQALKSADFVFINFYANWCRFSQILDPMFGETADMLKKDFPTEGDVILGKVDCDSQPDIASRYHISKYPTLKVFRNGEIQKREYRGQRSAEALANFVREQLKDPIKDFESLADLNKEEKKRKVVAFFEKKETKEYLVFKKVASTLRSECEFWIGLGDVSKSERPGGNDIIVFRPQRSQTDIIYSGDLNNYQLLFQWAQDKCIPLVREITFENAEELTEEGLPFLILFHNPDDVSSVDEYNRVISSELLHEKNSINFLTADGVNFAHPLHHLGKSMKDLPLIAIDSFRHMYMFANFDDIRTPGKLKQYVADLHSGKLHREFHQGPDPTPAANAAHNADGADAKAVGGDVSPDTKTTPPESKFKKLAPSKLQYTLLRDEL